jgi:hypothetical protein
MSQFTTPFRGEIIGKNLWRTIEPFEYHIGSYPSDMVITVPIGFITDFASVPRFIWPIISPIDTHAKAAVIHDYCYEYAPYSRKMCDLIFLEGMIVLNVPYWKRQFMYKFVRLCGWYNWWKCRIKQKKECL